MSQDGTWAEEELHRLGAAVELQLTSVRTDGTPRTYVTMWVARVGGDLYVRSAGGPQRPWYRRAVASGAGRVRAGGIERDVVFGEAGPDVHEALDAAYHVKYDRFGAGPVSHVTGPDARPVTIRLVRRSS